RSPSSMDGCCSIRSWAGSTPSSGGPAFDSSPRRCSPASDDGDRSMVPELSARSAPHAADEVVHAPVDTEELHDGVEQANGQEAPEPRDVDEPRHDEAAAVAADGVDDAVGGILRREDRQEQPEAGLHAFEHARADVERADDGRLDVAAEAAELEPQRLVEADGRVLARAVID